jgi:hypothetical protein
MLPGATKLAELYITASTSVYRIKLNIPGMKR